VFIIRNYGNSRTLPYKDKNYFIARDGIIETNDAELAGSLKTIPLLHVSGKPDDIPENSVSTPLPTPQYDLESCRTMKKRELLEVAQQLDIELPEKVTKNELLNLICRETKHG